MREDSQQPANSKLLRCERGETATQNQFSHCVKFPNESHNALAKLIPRSDSSTQGNDDVRCSGSKEDCNSKNRHTVRQTESKRSWQARCSNFIINLPVTFSKKIFCPRENCQALKCGKRTICDDYLRTNKDQLSLKKMSKPSLRVQTNKKSAQSWVSSLTDKGCHKNVGTESVFLEKANQIDLCCSKMSKSVREILPCRSSIWKSEKSTTTCKKVTEKCGRHCDNSFSRMKFSENYSNDICHRESKLHEPRLERGARNRMSTSTSKGKTREKCSVRFSNWPTILSEKLFGLQNEKVMRCCVIENEAELVKEMNGVTDIAEIVSQTGSSSQVKKERLTLKKYTISQTPEALEETLCFEILPGEKLTATKTKLQTQEGMKIDCDSRRKLATILKRNEPLGKCFEVCRSRASKRYVESKGNAGIFSSRKMQHLQKNTPTVPISLSNLIVKVLTRHRDNENVCKENKRHRNTVSERRRTERIHCDRECVSKYGTKTISRKHATTGIRKHKNKYIKRLRYIGNNSRQNKVVSCSLGQNVSLDCCPIDSPEVFTEEKARETILNDFSNEGEQGSQQGSTRTYHYEDNLDNVKDLCKKDTQTMIHGCTNRLQDQSDNLEDNQSCERFEFSKEKVATESGIGEMVGKRCRRGSREFCCTVLDRKNPELKSHIRQKDCNKVIGRRKFTYKVNRRNGIRSNDLRSSCQGQYDDEIISCQKKAGEGENCTQNHRDMTLCKKDFEDNDAPEESEACKLDNDGKNYSSVTPIEGRIRKRYHRKELPLQAKVYKKLIFKENYISNSPKDKRSRILLEGTRRMFVIAGENIRVKMFDNRETCTDDLPGAARCQSWKYSEEQRRMKKLMHNQSTLDEDIENTKKCSPTSLKTEENCRYTDIIRNSENQDTGGCYSRSGCLKQGPFSNKNDNSGSRKQSENGIRSEIECEKCVRLSRKTDTDWKCSAEISESEDVLEVERDTGKVRSSLGQTASGECETIVREGRNCLKKTSNESQTKESLNILNKDDQFRRNENIDMHSSMEINDCCLPPVATSKVCGTEEEGDSANEPSEKMIGTRRNQQVVNVTSRESGKLNRVLLNIHSCEKPSRWITSPWKNWEATRPESRNIIKSRYSQRKSTDVSRREAHGGEYTNAKKGKVQRESSASEKSITKTRKPFQQIENARQVGCTAKVVINSDKAKKGGGVVEKEESNLKKKTQHSQRSTVFDNNVKNSLTQTGIINESSFAYSSIAIGAAHALSIQKLNPEADTQGSRIAEKSRLSIKNKNFTRVSGSARNSRESTSAELKENLCKSLLKKESNDTADDGMTDGKRVTEKIWKIGENVESESSGRLGRSIDTCDTRDCERHKELETPAYVSDKENAEVKNLQIEMSSIGEQVIPNGATVATNWIAKESRNSKSSKSLSFQRNGKERVGGENGNSTPAKETEENKQTKKRNQSKSKTVSKKNEKDKKSTPLKLLSQIDSKIDANDSTQESVAMNADLFASALMDGKNNIKIYRDLQSASEENSNSNRISASKDEGLRKSATATTQSKSKVFHSPRNWETGSGKILEKSKNDQKLRNFRESANVAAKNGDQKMSKTFPSANNIRNGSKCLTANSELDQAKATGPSDAGSSRSTACKKNSNRERNFESQSPARSSKQVQLLETQNECDLQNDPNVSTGWNFDQSCVPRTSGNAVELPKNSSGEKSSVCVFREKPNDERLPLKSQVSSCRGKNGTRMNFDSDGKTKQEAHAKSNYADDRMKKNLDKNEKQGIYCGTNRNNTMNALQEGITEDEPRPSCEKSKDSASNGRELKRLSESFQKSSGEKQEQIAPSNDDSEKVTTPFIFQRMSSNKHFCFTDDLKRFLDQGQEFFTFKRRKNSDGIQEASPCGSCKSNDSETWCETTEFCETVDYEKLEKSSKIRNEDPTSKNSVSSLQKAYTTLRTILSRTKNVKKAGFIDVKDTKETQTCTPIEEKMSETIP